ncbi:hypothetical protein HDU83_004768 [Entophlyctis luteolus]|nr:hypothetical protein HDU83_004768 [Entophlyctis luteolus]KAJ3382919.1 hypothetical protein HDU84_003952 [Entophlyctis sp. JEL0112]
MKSRKHKRESAAVDDSDSDDGKRKLQRLGVQPLTDADYYARSAEFIVWLREKRHTFLDKLSADDAHDLFAKFVRRWNRGDLDDKFYRGIAATDFASNARTKHRWNFKVSKEDEARLAEAKDSVHVMTSASDGLSEDSKSREGKKGLTAFSLSSGEGLRRKREDNDDMDDEDRARYLAALRKKDAKAFETRRAADLEELVPKATGREAQLEKKKATSAYLKQERDTEIAYKDSDLMGGGDSFAAHLAREKQRKERIEERRQPRREEMDSRAQTYKAKEEATMAMLRELAKANGKM